MKLIVCKDYEEMSLEGAKIAIEQLKAKPDSVLGLCTGSTPIGMYADLVKANKAGEISFKKVKTYNLDEYYPIEPTNINSYRYFMNDNLFLHVDIDLNNTNVPQGNVKDPYEEAKRYEEAVRADRQMDIQYLGLGNNGHIAFNEPAENLELKTHVTGLTESTIQANLRFFPDGDIPTKALTMGIGTIMSAKRIVILINGKKKHEALMKLLDKEYVSTAWPCTMLKFHPDVTVICDKEAYEG